MKKFCLVQHASISYHTVMTEIGMSTDLIARFIWSRTSFVLTRTSFKQCRTIFVHSAYCFAPCVLIWSDLVPVPWRMETKCAFSGTYHSKTVSQKVNEFLSKRIFFSPYLRRLRNQNQHKLRLWTKECEKTVFAIFESGNSKNSFESGNIRIWKDCFSQFDHVTSQL